jgi:hypothetical protein
MEYDGRQVRDIIDNILFFIIYLKTKIMEKIKNYYLCIL